LLRHACSKTREARSDRCPYARRSDCAEASWVALAAGSSAAVLALSGAISTDLPHACANPSRSANGVPTASMSPSKGRVGGNSSPRQEKFDTKSQHAWTGLSAFCPGTTRRHRRSSTAAEKLKWNENKISERCAGLGRLPVRVTDGKIKRVSPLPELRS
jgi:hypothetical protein